MGDRSERLPSADGAIVRAIERATPHIPWAARERARQTLRALGQGVGAATASMRVLPSFLIIGAKRSGTTMLLRYLQQHPAIAPPFPSRVAIKGVRYFDNNYGRGEDWYRRHFPTRRHLARRSAHANQPAITGEASPYYLYHPLAAERVARDLPDARLLVILRDPVERAFSHYKKNVELFGIEDLSFEDALAAEEQRLAGEHDRLREDPTYVSHAYEHFAYVTQSSYAIHLAPWLQVMPRDQLLVCRTEDLQAAPQVTIDRITDFLGLSPMTVRLDQRRLNATSSTPIPTGAARHLQQRLAPLHEQLREILGEDDQWMP